MLNLGNCLELLEMKDDNKYVFPCGDKFSAIDIGYCQGVKVATIANDSINWGIEKCANCKLENFREFYTGEKLI